MKYNFFNARHQADDKQHVIAAHLQGKPKADQEDGKSRSGINVIFIADTDVVHDVMFNVWRERIADLYLDNVLFVLNCVDYLSGDDQYIEVRKRRPQHRSLTRIEQQASRYYRAASDEEAAAEKEAEEALQAAKDRLEAKIKEMEAELKAGSADINTVQNRLQLLTDAENRKLAQQEKEQKRQKDERIRRVRMETQQEVREIEAGAWKLAVLLSPLPALLLGLGVFFWRLIDERQGIASDRLR
jgi:ABC-2 type transport system permease protein